MSHQSHLKSSHLSNGNRRTIGQIRERQIKEGGGSLWSKGYENIHSNINVSSSFSTLPLPSLPTLPLPLPLKPAMNSSNNVLPDKEAIIIALQLEVDRLKAKVNSVIKTSEETITEFTLQHDDINNQYNNQYDELLKSYNDAIADRDKYKSIADNLTKDVQEERDNLRQTMKSLKDDSYSKNDNIQIRNYIKLETIAKAETVAVLSLLNDLLNNTNINVNNMNIDSVITDRKQLIADNADSNTITDNNIAVKVDTNHALNLRVDSALLQMWKNYDSQISFNDFFDAIVSKLKEIKAREISNSDNTIGIIQNLQKEKETLEVENTKAHEAIRDLNEKLAKLQDLTLDNNKFKQENDDLKEQLKEISVNYEESRNICMKLEQELLSITSVEQEHQDLKRENLAVSQSLALEISKSKALEEKVAILQNSNTSYCDEMEKLLKLNEMNDNINNSTSKLNEKIKSVIEQYESEKTKCKSLEDELNKANYDNEMLSTLLSAMEERNAKLDKQVEAVAATNTDLSNENRLKDEEILEARKKNEIIEEKFKGATSRVAMLEASLVEMSKEFYALTEKDCNKFHSTLKDYESRLDAANGEIEELTSNLSQVTKERDDATALQSALSQLTEEMEFKINQLEHDKKVLSDANNNTCVLNDELQKTTAEFLTVATSSIKELEEKLRLVEEERDQLLHGQDIMPNTKDNSVSFDNVHVPAQVHNSVLFDISIPFNPTKVESSSGNIFIQCITAMDEYSTYSQEELRFLSYKK